MLTGKKLGRAIESARIKKGVSKADLAREFEVKPPSVSGWVDNGRISKDKLLALIEYFADTVGPEHWGLQEPTSKVSSALGIKWTLNPPDNMHDNASEREIRGWIPLVSWVQAGEWSEAIDLYEPGYAEQVNPTTVSHSMRTFALRVEGDSMTAPPGSRHSFPHGLIIYVDPERSADVGDYVIARYNGKNKVTFKQLASEEGRPVLKPLNPDRQQYPLIRDEFEVIGKVIDASWGGL